MNPPPGDKGQHGFTLIELMVALGIFLLVVGAAFTLLASSQNRYRTESQVLTSFQEARLGLDQIVRDINDAGYPPPTYVSTNFNLFATTPFAWSPGYSTNSSCNIVISSGKPVCTTPGDFDLIIETNPNPQDPTCAPTCPVQWIRYQLQTPPAVQVPTLMRGVLPKAAGTDPAAAFAGANAFAPFVQNVVNTPVQPIFSYTCDTLATPQSAPLPCPNAAASDNFPANIRDVMINLIVATSQLDATTGQQRVVELRGRGRRINPNQ